MKPAWLPITFGQRKLIFLRRGPRRYGERGGMGECAGPWSIHQVEVLLAKSSLPA